jgi:hypothetical protein
MKHFESGRYVARTWDSECIQNLCPNSCTRGEVAGLVVD